MSKPADLSLLASAVEVVFESLAYGVFVLLGVVSTIILVRRKHRTPHLRFLLGTIWTMLLVSSLHWCTSLAYLVSQLFDGEVLSPEDGVIDAIAKINYNIADGVLVWRAWILSRVSSQRYRRLIALPFVTLGISIVLTIVAIGMRIAVNNKVAGFGSGDYTQLLQTLNFTQVGLLIFSTATNLLSTGLVGLCAWEHKIFLRASTNAIPGPTRALRILILLLESGLIYTAFVFMGVLASPFRVSFGTIGDVTSDLLIQLSGLYPTLIIIFVTLQKSAVLSIASFSSSAHPLPRLNKPHDIDKLKSRNAAHHVYYVPTERAQTSSRGMGTTVSNVPELELSTFEDFASGTLQRMQEVIDARAAS